MGTHLVPVIAASDESTPTEVAGMFFTGTFAFLLGWWVRRDKVATHIAQGHTDFWYRNASEERRAANTRSQRRLTKILAWFMIVVGVIVFGTGIDRVFF